ncbi:MAG: hypothetical protein J0I49_22845 [Pseudonocardia sp.]|uniref:hypothetical protein n=1 Tax=Pseudonocardia sp. TaxID=60912 RepID=UPI001AD30B77|nr:hypothetical protein [Pseudonocardia sp.]MBN9100923.1 hypothetical protein [Pseudonocardia sp.]
MTSPNQTELEDSESAGDPRQIDLVEEIKFLPVLTADGSVKMVPCPLGVAVVTQCCDLARGGKGHVHLAPIVALDPSLAREAETGRTPRYVPIPATEGRYIDLGTIGSAEHGLISAAERTPGTLSESDRHAVRQRVGRRFSRFAFPEELISTFGVLQKRVREKSGNLDSNFGGALEMLRTIRVESATGWDSEPPWDLTLVLVAEAGILPTDIFSSCTPENLTVDSASFRVLKAALSSLDMADAWLQLGAALKRDLEKQENTAISSIEVEVTDEDDFSYRRYRESISLDLDDLSEPAA